MAPRVLLLLSALVLASCAGKPQPVGGAPGLEVMAGDMPVPGTADIAPAGSAYQIGPLDTLKVDVFGIPELTDRQAVVDNDGQIAFPLIGTVPVAGLTNSEVTALITSRLRGEYIRDPQVTVQVQQATNRAVTVYGQVQQPGVYPLQGTSSLMKSVATARGLTKYSNSRDVVVFRTVNGQRMATLYNLDQISRGAYLDPQIYPNDVIVVGESKSRRLFDDIVGAATLITTPLTVFLQNN